MKLAPEGWYKDPYSRHSERWFSDGTPTSLVRDGGTTSTDEPPDEPFEGPLQESDTVPTQDETVRVGDEAGSGLTGLENPWGAVTDDFV